MKQTRSPLPDAILTVLADGRWTKTEAIHRAIARAGHEVQRGTVVGHLARLEDDYEVERRELGGGRDHEWRRL